MRAFVQENVPKRNAKGVELKSNATDNESAKMATSKGVIQGYAAQAAVDARRQVIVAADVAGSGSEQASLLPMVEASRAFADPDTVMTADAGYHSTANVQALEVQGIPAMIADAGMRKRDERLRGQAKHKAKPDPLYDKGAAEPEGPKTFKASEFRYDKKNNRCICPAGKALYSSGSEVQVKGITFHRFKGAIRDCEPCHLRTQCLRAPDKTKIRQVAINLHRARPLDAVERMRRAIDSPRGRRLYGQRIGTVEPVFGNLRHNKRLARFTVRGKSKVKTQWTLYCLVHNIEKVAGAL